MAKKPYIDKIDNNIKIYQDVHSEHRQGLRLSRVGAAIVVFFFERSATMGRATQLKPGDVSLGQGYEFFKSFGQSGGTHRMLQEAIEDHNLMRQLILVLAGVHPSQRDQRFVYNAVETSKILNISVATNSPPPPITPVGNVIVYYGGWSYPDLNSAVGYEYLRPNKPLDLIMPEPGYYEVLFPVPGSKGHTFPEQVLRLKNFFPDFQPAPLIIAATTWVVHLKKTGRLFPDVINPSSDLANFYALRCADVPTVEPMYSGTPTHYVLEDDGGAPCVSTTPDDWGQGYDKFLVACRKL